LTLIEAEPLDRFGYQAAHLKAKSPNVQAPAPRVFHLNRHDLAPRVIHLDGCALAKALAPRVFHLNYHAPEHAPAAGVFRLNRRDLAPRIFHLNHHAIRQVLAPDRSVSRAEFRLAQSAGR